VYACGVLSSITYSFSDSSAYDERLLGVVFEAVRLAVE